MRSTGVRWWDWAIAAALGVLVLGLAVYFWAAWAFGLLLYTCCLYLYFNWRAAASAPGRTAAVRDAHRAR